MKHLGYGGEDMFVVVVYDVHQSRCAKVMKYLMQWLEHRQRSVLSGFLSEIKGKTMQTGLLQIIKAKYDSVIIFQSNRATQISEWTTSGADRMRYSSIIGNGRQEGQGRIPRPKKRKAQKKQSFFRFKPAK